MKVLGKEWSEWTTGEKVYLSFWLLFAYIMIGMIVQDRQVLHSFLEIVLWPFMQMGFAI